MPAPVKMTDGTLITRCPLAVYPMTEVLKVQDAVLMSTAGVVLTEETDHDLIIATAILNAQQ